MSEFSAQDAIRSPWDPALKGQALRLFTRSGAALALVGALAWLIVSRLDWVNPLVWVIAVWVPLALAALALATACVISFNAILGGLIKKTAILLFVGSIVGIVLLAWGTALLYRYVDGIAAEQGPEAVQVQTFFAGELTVTEIHDQLPEFLPAGQLAGYLLWPFQFRLTRDLLGVIGVLSFVCTVAAFAIWWERKVAGRIQSRLGPMRVGGWHGWAQCVADGLKLIQKEDLIPTDADQPLFRVAPHMVFIPIFCAFLALPFGAAWVVRDLDVGLIFILAMVGIDVVGVILGGWASNNKWSIYGAMREACQMVSYEIPMGISLLVPVMTVGTLRLTTIGEMQNGGFHTWLAFANPFTFVAAGIYFVASLASCKRSPFDLPEAESELVAGFHTEYSGFRWALFFFGEYACMFLVGALATILFFGAWHSPLPASWGAAWVQGTWWQQALHGIMFSGPLWFVAKGFFFIYVQIWLRWTLPRIRIDQVMYACVQVLLPMAMVVLLGSTFWILLVPPGSLVALLANVVLTLIGVMAVLAFLATMVYGYANNRRLVGTQAIDHLPGA